MSTSTRRTIYDLLVSDFPIGSVLIIDGAQVTVSDHGWDHYYDVPFVFAWTPSRFGRALDRITRERIEGNKP